MKKGKILYTLIISSMVLGNSTFSFAGVSDVENHWAKKEIDYLIEKGMVNGYDDGTFKPSKNVTRAEFLKMVNNVFNLTETRDISFTDIKEDDWYYNEVRKAVAAGYISGYEDGTIRANRLITREEASKIIAVISKLDYDIEDISIDFKDNSEIGDWAKDYVSVMKYKGFMNGYEDGTFRPKRHITRGETAKILASISRDIEDSIGDLIDESKDKNYLVQVGSYSSLESANKQAEKLILAGFKDTFIIKDNYYYVIVGKFSSEDEAQVFKTIVGAKGFETIVITKDFDEKGIIKPEEPTKEKLKYEEFISLVDELPNSKDIKEIVAGDKEKVEKLRQLYDSLTSDEMGKITDDKINKFKEVESKIESLKTPIKSSTKASVSQAQAWAISKGAHKRFVDAALYYWQYGELSGMNPEILYAQAAKETNFGRYTGAVKPEMNNWAGIKILEPVGDSTYDHEMFLTPEDGVRAHFNHMGIYCGIDPIGQPHPRWYKTMTSSWAGKVLYVEDLGGRWAPNSDYGISITRDYLNNLYKTSTPSDEDIHKALEFSKRVDELLEEDTSQRLELIAEYDNLSDSQKALVPYNIKERIGELIAKYKF